MALLPLAPIAEVLSQASIWRRAPHGRRGDESLAHSEGMRRFPKPWRWAALGLGLFLLAGCSSGGSGTYLYAISGTVSGAVTQGVLMTLSGAQSGTTTTGTGGVYAFTGLPNGSYTVTPSLSGYSFSPTSLSVNVNGSNVPGQNFTATAGGSSPDGGLVWDQGNWDQANWQ